MEALLVGFSLSATGGLEWLTYNCPKFAAKLLLGLLVCSVLIQIGLRSYQCGYRDCQSSISQGFSKDLPGFALLKKKRVALNNFIAARVRSSPQE
jgi:hypothetical protein